MNRWFWPIVVAIAGAGCAHQPPAPRGAAAGLERSVFPVYVSEGPDRLGAWPRARGPYRACSGVYVAPGVLATSDSAFPPETDGMRFVDRGAVAVTDGDYALDVRDVTFPEEAPGLALVRTKEPGVPVPLRAGPLPDDEPLRLAGLSFSAARRAPRAVPDWEVHSAEKLDTARAGRVAWVEVARPLRPGACGAAVLDKDGRLAGILLRGGPRRALVVPAPVLERALSGEGG